MLLRPVADSTRPGDLASRPGRNRYGNSGGKHKAYYHAYYATKGKGKAAVVAFKRTYGKPPSSGGEA